MGHKQESGLEETKQNCSHSLLKSGGTTLFGQLKELLMSPSPRDIPLKSSGNQIGIKSVGLQNAVNKTPLNAENKALGASQLPV